MDNQMLERLMLDHSLGALDDDVVRLLEAYLKDNPAAAAQDRQLCDVVSLARQASASPAPAPLAPLKVRRPLAVAPWRWAAGALAAAGCVAIGLTIGLLAPRAATVAPTASLPTAITPAPCPKAVARTGLNTPPPSSADGDIWSQQRFLARLREPRRQAPPLVQWSSPVMTPRFGDGT
jgi:hypothetical protein